MDLPILQSRPDLRQIHLHLLNTPTPQCRQQIETPAFNTLFPMDPVILSHLLHLLVGWPAANRQFPAVLDYVYETGFDEPFLLLVDCAEGLAEAVAEVQGDGAPLVEYAVGEDGAVVGFGSDADFELFEPAAGFEVASRTSVQLPLFEKIMKTYVKACPYSAGQSATHPYIHRPCIKSKWSFLNNHGSVKSSTSKCRFGGTSEGCVGDRSVPRTWSALAGGSGVDKVKVADACAPRSIMHPGSLFSPQRRDIGRRSRCAR